MKLNQNDIDAVLSAVNEALYENLDANTFYDKSVAIKEHVKHRLREDSGLVSIEEHNKRAMELNYGKAKLRSEGFYEE